MPEQPENAATEEENDFPARGPGGLRCAADVEKPAEPKDAETEEKKVHEQPEDAAAEEKQEAPATACVDVDEPTESEDAATEEKNGCRSPEAAEASAWGHELARDVGH